MEIGIAALKCSNKETQTRLFLINPSDLVIKDGNVRIKRKYGKLKREVIEYERNEN